MYTKTAILLALSALLTTACSNPETEKLRHFETGNEYAAEKRYEHAIVEYRNAVRLDPKFGEARFKLAQAYEQTNNLREAFPEFIRAADAWPDNREAQIKAIGILSIARRFEDAKARATTLVERDPKDIDALLLLAQSMAGLKDPEGAIAEIEEALKIQPDDSRAYLSLGAVQLLRGEAQQAEAALKRALTVDPSSVPAHLAFTNYLWSVGRPAEAEESLKRAIELQPRDLLANRMLATFYAATKRADQAEQPLKIVAEVSDTAAARFQLADYYIGNRRPKEAIGLLTELAKDPGASADAEFRLASIEYIEGKRDEAHHRVDVLIKRVPNHSPALTLKARWLTGENKLDEALELAKAAVAAGPQSASAHYALAVVHDRRREVPDAIKAFNEVLRLNPRAADAQVQLSRLTLASGNRDAALQYAEGAKQSEPRSGAARLVLARTLLARGDLARAEGEISQLMRAQPNEARVHFLDGALQAGKGDVSAARKSYDRALQLSPGLVDAIAGLTELDLAAKQIGPAVTRIESALAEKSDNLDLLALAARVYMASGNSTKAEQSLKRAVIVDPRFSTGYAMLAGVYFSQGRVDEARAEFEGMVTRDPSSVEARTMVGVLLETQNKRQEAKKWYEATVALTESAPIAANNLAFIYAEEGANLDVALKLASSAKQLLPDSPDVDDTLGWVYYKKDLATLAVGPLEESIKKAPNRAEALYHLGLTYAKLGEKAKARETLERALKLNPKFPHNEDARKTLLSVAR